MSNKLEVVTVRYKGNNGNSRYTLRPGGTAINAQGYILGRSSGQARMTRFEAELLVAPNAKAEDVEGQPFMRLAGLKQVPVLNGELVSRPNNQVGIVPGDQFEIVEDVIAAKAEASKPKKKEAS